MKTADFFEKQFNSDKGVMMQKLKNFKYFFFTGQNFVKVHRCALTNKQVLSCAILCKCVFSFITDFNYLCA